MEVRPGGISSRYAEQPTRAELPDQLRRQRPALAAAVSRAAPHPRDRRRRGARRRPLDGASPARDAPAPRLRRAGSARRAPIAPVPALAEIGLAAIREDGLGEHMRPFMERLRDEVNETVQLVVLQGANGLFIETVESHRPLRTASRVGIVVPAHCLSGGKALLAELPLDRLHRVYPMHEIPAATPHSIATRDELEAHLAAVRERGYATNFGESEEEIGSIAVAVHDSGGRPRAGPRRLWGRSRASTSRARTSSRPSSTPSTGPPRTPARRSRERALALRAMALADTFSQIVESLPDDWTDLELDLRIADEKRYVDAATYLVTCNAQPYSKHDWHWKLLVAHRFGHAAAVPACHGALKLLDDAGIEGELALREMRSGRVEIDADVGPAAVLPRRVQAHPSAVDGPRARARARPLVRLEGPGDARRGRPRGRARRLAGGGGRADRRRGRPRRRPHAGRRRGHRAARRARRPPATSGRRARWPSTATSTPTCAPARSPRASTSSCRARGWRAKARRSSTASSRSHAAAG